MTDPDLEFLDHAAGLAFRCPPSDKAFAVGCVIADAMGNVVSAGYSREWGEGWHAEEVAIEKARRAQKPLKGCTLYSTIEPCSVRLSGKTPCCAHIAAAGIACVIFCLREPPVFVDGNGVETLEKAGISVIQKENDALKKRIADANPSVL